MQTESRYDGYVYLNVNANDNTNENENDSPDKSMMLKVVSERGGGRLVWETDPSPYIGTPHGYIDNTFLTVLE